MWIHIITKIKKAEELEVTILFFLMIKEKIRFTLGTAPGWTLLRTLQSMIPLLKPSLNSSSEGSAGKSFAATTPTIFLSHPAASYLLEAVENISSFRINTRKTKKYLNWTSNLNILIFLHNKYISTRHKHWNSKSQILKKPIGSESKTELHWYKTQNLRLITMKQSK